MSKNDVKIDFHNFTAKDAITLAIWGVAAKFMYEQVTPEIKICIANSLDHIVAELASKGVVWSSKSNCYLQDNQLILETFFAETPSDVLKPTKVEVRLYCG